MATFLQLGRRQKRLSAALNRISAVVILIVAIGTARSKKTFFYRLSVASSTLASQAYILQPLLNPKKNYTTMSSTVLKAATSSPSTSQHTPPHSEADLPLS
jgi:hypothetical protein